MLWLPEEDNVKDPITGDDLIDDEDVVEDEEIEKTSNKKASEKEKTTVEEEEVEDVDEDEDEDEDEIAAAELDDLKKQLHQTQMMLKRMMAGQTSKIEEAPEEKFEVPEFNFLQNVDMDELMTNPKLLNTMLNQAAKHGAKFAYDQSLKVVPKRITPVVQKRVSEAQKVENFFASNPDIAQFRPYFNSVVSEVYANDPTITVDNLLKETAKRVRKDLKLSSKPVTKRKNTGAVSPNRSTNFQKKKNVPLSESQKALEYIRKKRGEIQYPHKKKG